MHPVIKRVIGVYPIVKKFPMPVGILLLVLGGIVYSYTIMLIGTVMVVGRVWELAYQNQVLHTKLDAEDRAVASSQTTTGSGR